MIRVVLTANLQKYYPQREFSLSSGQAATMRELLARMDEVRPLFSSYILEDDSTVRRHVNLFLNGKLLPKNEVNTPVRDGDTVHIMQALSGG